MSRVETFCLRALPISAKVGSGDMQTIVFTKEKPPNHSGVQLLASKPTCPNFPHIQSRVQPIICVHIFNQTPRTRIHNNIFRFLFFRKTQSHVRKHIVHSPNPRTLHTESYSENCVSQHKTTQTMHPKIQKVQT